MPQNLMDEDADRDEHLTYLTVNGSLQRQLVDSQPYSSIVHIRIHTQCPQRICASRMFSTMAGGDKTICPITKKPRANEQDATVGAEFTSYLSAGETKQSSIRPDHKRRPRVERDLILKKDMQLYEDIVRKRARLKERNRNKMAANVYRALWGNVAICAAKLGAWTSSGSSALLAEFVHSVVDCGNQALLIVGLRESQMSADGRHPYGYGKSIYFWALVSALGTFFLGAGVSMTHAIGNIMEPSLQTITPEVWGVLLFSLAVDGYVLTKTVAETRIGQPPGISYWSHLQRIRDPAIMAVLLEDGAACLGILMACGGIAASHVTGNPVFDGVAGVGISTLLGVMGVALTRMNYRFLLGKSVDKDITDEIEQILLKRKSIDRVKSVQSQWTGPDSFSYKAEVDFDGT